jgi:hypothetical protein
MMTPPLLPASKYNRNHVNFRRQKSSQRHSEHTEHVGNTSRLRVRVHVAAKPKSQRQHRTIELQKRPRGTDQNENETAPDVREVLVQHEDRHAHLPE